jgi:transcription elongation GreA/GreB family factor
MKRKEQLYQLCLDYVNQRLQTFERTIESHQKALTSETKSSAGDKHETGRAMLQLEMEKASQQFEVIQQMKETLTRIDPTKSTETASLGSLIETNLGTYYLSISAGQLQLHNETYFAISTSSPIGKLLLGKKVKDRIRWNDKQIQVLAIL